jgi:hypothetical protein
MNNQVSLPPPITRDSLITEFARMRVVRVGSSNSRYTHFIPEDDWDRRKNNTLERKYPICECNCSESMSRKSRLLLVEKPLFEKIKLIFEMKRPLVLFCIGSGECYQELSLCIGLAKLGYDVKHIVLADWKYKDNQPNTAALAFSTLFKLLFPNAQISFYSGEHGYVNDMDNLNQPKPDIILCIDVENARLNERQTNYSSKIGASNICILAYHNNDVDGKPITFVDSLPQS